MRAGSFSSLVAFAVLTIGPAAARANHRLPTVIPLPEGFQPEGITRGEGNVLYVAGIANGGIYALDPRSGGGSFLVPPQTNGRKAVGLKLQRRADRLFVAGGETGHAYVYDSETGESLADLVLATPTPESGSFVNDVILTGEAAYFTDSFRPVFYRVALDCKDVPSQDDVETIPLGGDYQSVEGFNANGIEVTPQGDLLIVNGATGKLYRVDPESGLADEIELAAGGSLVNGDGLVLRGRTLWVVENFSNQVVAVKLSRRFGRGTIVRTITNPNFDIPATAAFFKGALYVTNARFSTPPTPTTIYTVVRVPIE
jgi:sugar lactone lactonase YvrE